MSHTYSQNTIHLIFSTKDRTKTITPELQPELWAFIAGICRNEGIFVHAIGGSEDHIHCLLQLPPTAPLAKAVLTIKSNSSRWLRSQILNFAWQQGYGAFSVSNSLTRKVDRYIRNQEAHHRRMSFEDEFLALLRRHCVPYDPKFVFG